MTVEPKAEVENAMEEGSAEKAGERKDEPSLQEFGHPHKEAHDHGKEDVGGNKYKGIECGREVEMNIIQVTGKKDERDG